ncbi:hypothetical protein [Burkholderia sp. BCC1998]|uniref:hypothetical protein n=1 Tax=Burkholderia sp. BCC1998 TaxID=2817447 RepID=UPI002AB66ECD|nr:hypothetical protein [Burkholderia sp. BCC1998]
MMPSPASPSLTRTINLHNLEAVRREMYVYRDMRLNRIDSQADARFVFALSQIAKMFEICDLEHCSGQLGRQTTLS